MRHRLSSGRRSARPLAVAVGVAICIGLGLLALGTGMVAGANSSVLEQVGGAGQPRLYVLGAGSGDPTAGSRVSVLNSVSGQVLTSIMTGYDPQMGLSPDGTRLFVADTQIGQPGVQADRLRVLDALSGYQVVGTVELPDRIRSPGDTGFRNVLVGSRDGRYVYALHYSGARRDGMMPNTEFWVSAYDTVTGRRLDSQLNLPRACGAASIHPLRDSGMVATVCAGAVLSIAFGDVRGGAPVLLELPGKGAAWANDVAGSAISPDGSTLYVVRRDATVHVIDTLTRSITRSLSLPLTAGEVLAAPPERLPPTGPAPVINTARSQAPGTDATTVQAPSVVGPVLTGPLTPLPVNALPRKGLTVAYNQVQISGDGRQLLVGVRGPGPEGESVAQRIWTYDVGSWSRVANIQLSDPAVTFAIGQDRQEIYPASASSGRLSAITAQSGTVRNESVAALGRVSLVLAEP